MIRWRECSQCGTSCRCREGGSCRRCLMAIQSRKQAKKLSEQRRRARLVIQRNPALDMLLGKYP